MNCMCYERPISYQDFIINFERGAKEKFFYTIEEVNGDYYYKLNDKEEIYKKAIHVIEPSSPLYMRTHEDIEHFAQDIINKKLPLDGPLWRLYI